jgi:hypothetical protein
MTLELAEKAARLSGMKAVISRYSIFACLEHP